MFEWTIPGRKNHSASWYTIAGILTLSLAIWGVLTQMYALTLVVIIMAGVYILLENNAPDFSKAGITGNGIFVGEGFYDFGQINSFEIVFDNQIPRYLRIFLNKGSLKMLEVPLVNLENPEETTAEIRAFLLNYIAEGTGGEINMFDRIIDRLGL